ncbi:MAG: hypothetical protein IJB34_01140 [Clostridia bacterium]|nr:hypothetical protein [Clostridia bacterium]
MSEKNKTASALSALVLLAFAVIWLVYLCAGNHMQENVAQNLSYAVTVLFALSYIAVISLPSDAKLGWVLISLLACFLVALPGAVLDIFALFGVEPSLAPWLKSTLSIGQQIGHIALYIFLVANSFQLTKSFLFRLLFIAIGLFLVFCVVTAWVPALAQILPVPLIGFESTL